MIKFNDLFLSLAFGWRPEQPTQLEWVKAVVAAEPHVKPPRVIYTKKASPDAGACQCVVCRKKRASVPRRMLSLLSWKGHKP